MTNDQAEFLLNEVYLPQIQNEHKTTTRVIAAIPADQGDWKPHPTSMGAMQLGWHIASSECFFLNGIVAGKFEPGGGSMPESIKTPQDVVAWSDENFAKATAALSTLKGGDLTRMIEFFGVFNLPAIVYVGFMNSHAIHHRGQLSAYLRPMGGKVPSIYGGSADEPFQVPASAKA